MSLNGKVSGKIATSSRNVKILSIEERQQKEEEDRRRILRLQQVRAESKNIAAKIRNDVAAEKERQIRRLEAMKLKELDCWREHVLAHKHNDYRTAIYQVGEAHYAARRENALKTAIAHESPKLHRTKPRTSNTTRLCKPKVLCEKKTNKTSATQTSLTPNAKTANICKKPVKRKCNVCPHEKSCCTCSDNSKKGKKSLKKQYYSQSDLSSCSSSMSDSNIIEECEKLIRTIDLQQTDPVVLEVNTDTKQLPEIDPPALIEDTHVKTNRQFTHVVSNSPSKHKQPQSDVAKPSAEEQGTSKSTISTSAAPTKPIKKRFTQISTLLEKKRAAETSVPASPPKQSRIESPTSLRRPTRFTSPASPSKSTRVESPASPRKSTRLVRPASPRKSTRIVSPESPRKSTRLVSPATPRKQIAPANSITSQNKKGKTVVQPTLRNSRSRQPASANNEPVASYSLRKVETRSTSKSPVKQSKPTIATTRNKPRPLVTQKSPTKQRIGIASKTPNKHKVDNLKYPRKHSTISTKSSYRQHTIPSGTQAPNTTPRKSSDRSVTPLIDVRPVNESKCIGCGHVCRGAIISCSPSCQSHSNQGRVQFYDYFNKFEKEYLQPTVASRAQSLERDEPTAMEQADVEKQTQDTKSVEQKKQRQVSEERGQRALEREQVRRDCDNLTEKLDALMQSQSNVLPTDERLQSAHHYKDAAARKETKMNAMLEDILLQPSIITCPEVRGQERKAYKKKAEKSKPFVPAKAFAATDVNLGMHPSDSVEIFSSTSDSCCSLLLGYVNDRSQQLRNDLNECEKRPQENHHKKERLKSLLQRIESLRQLLQRELQSEGGTSLENTTVQQHFVHTLNNMHKEREHILANSKDIDQTVLKQRMSQLREKEMLLEKKMQELCNLQQSVYAAKAELEEAAQAITTGDNAKKTKIPLTEPVEVVIQLRNTDKNTRKRSPAKNSHTLATLIPATQTPKSSKKRATSTGKQKKTVVRQSSYDSNSTAYRSLPSALNNDMDTLVQEIADGAGQTPQQASSHGISSSGSSSSQLKEMAIRLNPLIAHYVQRLLGMSRKSVLDLGVSSSTTDTPSSSVVDVPNNTCRQLDRAQISQERMERIQRFIEDNHQFIEELEQTLRSQTNTSAEASFRAFEQIWKQRLREQSAPKQTSSTHVEVSTAQPSSGPTSKEQIAINTTSKSSNLTSSNGSANPTQAAANRSQRRIVEYHDEYLIPHNNSGSVLRVTSSTTSKAAAAKTKANQQAQPQQQPKTSPPQTRAQPTKKKVSAKTSTKQDKAVEVMLPNSDAEGQIARYAQLTQNCTQRISELSQLIHKVRQEKQRLLEKTLSSSSENGRNSTEYYEVPQPQPQQQPPLPQKQQQLQPSPPPQLRAPGRNSPQNDDSIGSTVPLEKHKLTTASRDSGICMSRPLTAQEQHAELEPLSLSSTRSSCNSRQQQLQHSKPPATLRRFSPQLVADDSAHELSAILEVDTPVTSRTCIQQPQEQQQPQPQQQPQEQQQQQDVKQVPIASRTIAAAGDAGQEEARRLPTAFPTFEQYVRQCNIDMSQVDHEKSIKMQADFNELLATARQAQGKHALNYEEFPSLTTYLQNQDYSHDETTLEMLEQLLACLRLKEPQVNAFPTNAEYMQQIHRKSTELIDSASLKNVSTSLSDSETPDIEEELMRRNILKQPFNKNGDKTAPQTKEHKNGSGEKLSSSDTLSGSLERELLALGMMWPSAMRKKLKESQALSISTSTSESSPNNIYGTDKKVGNKSGSHSGGSHDIGRPLNVREFLIKELMKRSHSSTTNSDESFKSQFFNSILGTLTSSEQSPNIKTNTGAGSGSNAPSGTNIDRQKTSTPVNSQNSELTGRIGRTSSGTSSTTAHLFSGESHLSSVYFQETSPSVAAAVKERKKSEVKHVQKNDSEPKLMGRKPKERKHTANSQSEPNVAQRSSTPQKNKTTNKH